MTFKSKDPRWNYPVTVVRKPRKLASTPLPINKPK